MRRISRRQFVNHFGREMALDDEHWILQERNLVRESANLFLKFHHSVIYRCTVFGNPGARVINKFFRTSRPFVRNYGVILTELFFTLITEMLPDSKMS